MRDSILVFTHPKDVAKHIRQKVPAGYSIVKERGLGTHSALYPY
jgi:hypothetical protein